MRAKKLIPGPLQAEVAAFTARLKALGYSASVLYAYPRVARMLDDHLAREGVTRASEVVEHLDDFFQEIRKRRKSLPESGPLAHGWGRALDLFVGQLREHGVLEPLPKPELPPRLAEYLQFLSDHCGLTSLRQHKDEIQRFLTRLGARTDEDLASISIADVDKHVLARGRRLSRRSMVTVVGPLRGFLGHLFVQGVLRTDLRQHVVRPHIYSLESLPRSIPWTEVQRTLASVRRGAGVAARRDYAILVLLSACGLRANEVANLRLQDIDWRRDILRIHRTKSRSVEELPLVSEVGTALLAYLRERPTGTGHSRVFLTVRAPIVPLTRGQVTTRAGKHLRRAGVQAPHLGAHTLRHSHAMHLLRHGFSLKAIGDVLGHRSPQSTLVYTKGAVEDLREVAQEIDEVQP